jgi:hypothetical protein
MFGVGFNDVFMSRFAGTFSPSRFTDGMTIEFLTAVAILNGREAVWE